MCGVFTAACAVAHYMYSEFANFELLSKSELASCQLITLPAAQRPTALVDTHPLLMHKRTATRGRHGENDGAHDRRCKLKHSRLKLQQSILLYQRDEDVRTSLLPHGINHVPSFKKLIVVHNRLT